jgi:hypothetical protein
MYTDHNRFYTHADKIMFLSAKMQWFRSWSILVMGSLILPILIIFQTFSINIEHRAVMGKPFSLPIPKWSIYSAKYVYVVFLNALCLTLFASLLLPQGIY